MSNENYLIHTSVSEAQVNLEHLIKTNPIKARNLAEKALEVLSRSDGHKCRRQMIRSMLNKANKIIDLR